MPILNYHARRQNHVLIRNSITRWRSHNQTLVLLHLETSIFQQDSFIQSFRQFKSTPFSALSLSQKKQHKPVAQSPFHHNYSRLPKFNLI